MTNIIDPADVSIVDLRNIQAQIDKLEMHIRLRRLIMQSLATLSEPPVTGTVTMRSRPKRGDQVPAETLWHHYPLTEPTIIGEGGVEFMLRLPDGELVFVDDDWTQPVDLNTLNGAHIGAIMGAINTLVNTRTAS